jgi:uncharacterized protein (TIGR04255 family)
VSFEAPHYGLFWQQVRKRFPRSRTLPALVTGQRIEIVPNEPSEITVQAIVNAPDMPRVWFVSPDETTLIQLQPDRFLFNWREGRDRAKYPRFKWILARFRRFFMEFQRFVTDNNLGDLAPTQAELTYINHIKQGEGWSTLDDIGGVFPDLSWRRAGKRFTPAPQSVHFRSSHELVDGTLSALIQSARSRPGDVPLIRFDLSVRSSAVARLEGDSFWNWFEVANALIDSAFLDLTSERVQVEIWKRVK